MFFHKCGCLVAHEKCIFPKCFSVLTCLWCKMISVFILPSNTIFRKTERERESVCASEIALARRERERKKREPIAGDPRASTLPATQRLRATNPDRRSTLYPLTSPANPEPKSNLRLRRDCTQGSHWDGTNRIEIAIEKWLGFDEFGQIWPDLMNFFWLGFVSVFIYWEMVLYICLEAEKMWGTRRKCVFYIIFSNITKH